MTKSRKLPAEFKDYHTTREVFEIAAKRGFKKSLVWWKSMVGHGRIPSADFAGRKLIHKDEIEKVIKQKPKLHLSDLVSRP